MAKISAILVLNFIFLFLSVTAKKNIHLEKVDLDVIDSEHLNVAVNIRHEDGKSLVDVDADVKEDITKEIFFQLTIDKKTENSVVRLYKGKLIDRCTFAANRELYPVEKALTDDMDKHGNLFQSCPVKKGHYYMKGFEFKPRGVIAENIDSGEFHVHFNMYKEVETKTKALFSLVFYAKVD